MTKVLWPDLPAPEHEQWVVRVVSWVRDKWQRGWFKPRRIGCVSVLMCVFLLLFVWTWNSFMSIVFPSRTSPVVSGSPFDGDMKNTSPSTGSVVLDRIDSRHRVFVAVLSVDGFSDKELNHSFSGTDIDLLTAVVAQMHIDPSEIRYKQVYSHNTSVGMLSRGEADFAVGAFDLSADYSREADYVGPYDGHFGLAIPSGDPVFHGHVVQAWQQMCLSHRLDVAC